MNFYLIRIDFFDFLLVALLIIPINYLYYVDVSLFSLVVSVIFWP